MTGNLVVTLSFAMAFGCAATGARALDIGIGDIGVSVGGDDGGVSVSVDAGDSSVGASVGGGGVSVSAGSGGASAGATLGGGGASVATGAGAGTGGGELIGLASADGGIDGSVDLAALGLDDGMIALVNGLLDPTGAAFDGLDLDGILDNPPGAGLANVVRLGLALRQLDARRKTVVKLTCRTVLRSPKAFDRDIVALCRLAARA